jgi:hypothetical protein
MRKTEGGLMLPRQQSSDYRTDIRKKSFIFIKSLHLLSHSVVVFIMSYLNHPPLPILCI